MYGHIDFFFAESIQNIQNVIFYATLSGSLISNKSDSLHFFALFFIVEAFPAQRPLCQTILHGFYTHGKQFILF